MEIELIESNSHISDYVEICNSSVDGFTQHVSYFCCTID